MLTNERVLFTALFALPSPPEHFCDCRTPHWGFLRSPSRLCRMLRPSGSRVLGMCIRIGQESRRIVLSSAGRKWGTGVDVRRLIGWLGRIAKIKEQAHRTRIKFKIYLWMGIMFLIYLSSAFNPIMAANQPRAGRVDLVRRGLKLSASLKVKMCLVLMSKGQCERERLIQQTSESRCLGSVREERRVNAGG
jgi:hypothetical protein